MIETKNSIRSDYESQQPRHAGSPSRARGRRADVPVSSGRTAAERQVVKAVEADDLASLRDARSGPEPVASMATVLSALVGHRLGGAHRPSVDEYLRAAASVGAGSATLRRHFSIRCLLTVAPGVMARGPVSPSMLAILAAEDAADDDRAVDALATDPIHAHQALALARRLEMLTRHEEVALLTDGIVNLDPWTALLGVARGRSLTRMGRSREATAAFSESMRLARTPTPIVVGALRARARTSLVIGRRKQAIADVVRAATISESPIDGSERVVRGLRARR